MKRYRGAALGMVLALGLTACSTKPSGSDAIGAEASATAETQMGRWVESQVDIGNREIAGGPTLLDDGSLVLYVYEQNQDTFETGPLLRLTSTDDGATWSEEDTGWNNQVNGFVSQVWSGTDGTACLCGVVLDEEGNNNSYQIYLQEPGSSLEPLKIEEIDSVYDAVFYQKSLLLFDQTYGEGSVKHFLTNFDLETGKAQTIPMDDASGYGGGIQPVVAGDKLIYLCYTETSMSLMELNPQDGSSTQLLNALSEAVAPNALIGDSDGAIYYPAQNGIYRLAPGGTLPEQLVPGDGTALSVVSNFPLNICRTSNGDFLVMLTGDDGTRAVYRYHYDTTLPTHAETTLHVWSLRDSATARAAVNLFRQEHPEVDVTFTVAIPDGAQDKAAARNDALTQLNTELLAGEGPDLLLLDDVGYETYMKKGLLADLSDVLPLSELQKNIADPFVEEGKVYVMPARFDVPVLIGDDGALDGLTDLATMQQAVLDAPPRPNTDSSEALPDEERYALRITGAEDFADFLLPVTANAILSGNRLDEEALRQVMTFVEEVSAYYDTKNATSDDTWGSAESWTGTDVINILPEQAEYSRTNRARFGWFDLDTPYSVLAISRRDSSSEILPCDIMLRPGMTAGAYVPKVLVGVNAGSLQLDLAKELAATFFADGVQGSYYSDGMTVRADCLSDKVNAAMQNEYVSADTVQGDIQALLNSCTTPVVVPAVLRDSFVQHADAIIQGQENVEEAVKGIQSDLSLYLAEQQ